MDAIIKFKDASGPTKIYKVLAVLRTKFCTKIVTERNRVTSYENCDIQDIFLEDFGK